MNLLIDNQIVKNQYVVMSINCYICSNKHSNPIVNIIAIENDEIKAKNIAIFNAKQYIDFCNEKEYEIFLTTKLQTKTTERFNFENAINGFIKNKMIFQFQPIVLNKKNEVIYVMPVLFAVFEFKNNVSNIINFNLQNHNSIINDNYIFLNETNSNNN